MDSEIVFYLTRGDLLKLARDFANKGDALSKEEELSLYNQALEAVYGLPWEDSIMLELLTLNAFTEEDNDCSRPEIESTPLQVPNIFGARNT